MAEGKVGAKSDWADSKARALDIITKVISEKGGQYTIEPASECPLRTLNEQLYLKAWRARRLMDGEDIIAYSKLRDELTDTAVYAILLLARLIEMEDIPIEVKPVVRK